MNIVWFYYYFSLNLIALLFCRIENLQNDAVYMFYMRKNMFFFSLFWHWDLFFFFFTRLLICAWLTNAETLNWKWIIAAVLAVLLLICQLYIYYYNGRTDGQVGGQTNTQTDRSAESHGESWNFMCCKIIPDLHCSALSLRRNLTCEWLFIWEAPPGSHPPFKGRKTGC